MGRRSHLTRDTRRRRAPALTIARRSLAVATVVGAVAWTALSAYVPGLAVCERTVSARGEWAVCRPVGTEQLLPLAALATVLLAPDIGELGIGGVTLRWRARRRGRLAARSGASSSGNSSPSRSWSV